MQYERGLMIIDSDYEIRILGEEKGSKDVDLIIPMKDRSVNIIFSTRESVPISRIQLPSVNCIVVRFCEEEGNDWATIHFLKNMDLGSHFLNFEINYQQHKISIKEREFYVDFLVMLKEK